MESHYVTLTHCNFRKKMDDSCYILKIFDDWKVLLSVEIAQN